MASAYGCCAAQACQQRKVQQQQAPVISRLSSFVYCPASPAAAEGVPALVLSGECLDTPGLEVLCRFRGRQARCGFVASSDGASASLTEPPIAPSAVVECGVAMVECCVGAFAAEPKPMLVLGAGDAALAAELDMGLRQLLLPTAAKDGTVIVKRMEEKDVEMLLCDLGLVLQHAQDYKSIGDIDVSLVSAKAARLLSFACDMGWACLIARLLPLAAAHSVLSAPAQTGLTLMHRAVRSGSVAAVACLLRHGSGMRRHHPPLGSCDSASAASDVTLPAADGVHAAAAWCHADVRGPGGLTPLHLASLLEDASIALLLLARCPPSALTRLAADDGTTPFHLAFQMGHFDIPTLVKALHRSQQEQVCVVEGGREAMTGKKRPLQAPSAAKRSGKKAPLQSKARGLKCAEVGPCELCHSTVPPLLLDVSAACSDCGKARPCVNVATTTACDQEADDEDFSEDTEVMLCATDMCCDDACSAGALRRGRHNGAADVCEHASGNRYSVVALCQGCHSNRALEVII